MLICIWLLMLLYFLPKKSLYYKNQLAKEILPQSLFIFIRQMFTMYMYIEVMVWMFVTQQWRNCILPLGLRNRAARMFSVGLTSSRFQFKQWCFCSRQTKFSFLLSNFHENSLKLWKLVLPISFLWYSFY